MGYIGYIYIHFFILLTLLPRLLFSESATESGDGGVEDPFAIQVQCSLEDYTLDVVGLRIWIRTFLSNPYPLSENFESGSSASPKSLKTFTYDSFY